MNRHFDASDLFSAVAEVLKGKVQKVELTDAPAVEHLQLAPFIGPMRGIQGHQNSCYLDATLFAMFGLTSKFDEVLFGKQTDGTAKSVLETMCEEIIFPLRRCSPFVVLCFSGCWHVAQLQHISCITSCFAYL